MNSCFDRPSPKIIGIDKHSIAEDLNWKIGDRLVALNSNPVHDVLDLLYYEDETELDVTLLTDQGKQKRWFIEKDPDVQLGIELEPLSVQVCKNKCIFCFVHQQPRGLRNSLYIKDEDYRFSFLHGNFVTLSHISEVEFDRIIRLHLSPLYVSVHATDEKVRSALLGSSISNNILDLLNRLTSSGIKIHAQIVLCPGYNDGRILDKTIKDLEMLSPMIESVAIVPVGLTCHRRNLPKLRQVGQTEAELLLSQYIPKQYEFREKKELTWLYFADEFYILTGKPFPSLDEYDNFPQIENGVGLCRQFIDDWYSALDSRSSEKPYEKKIKILTGALFAPVLKRLVRETFGTKSKSIKVLAVPNKLFGKTVTVTGLLSGTDIISICERDDHRSSILLPDIIFNSDGITLDDLSLDDLLEQTSSDIIVINSDAHSLSRILEFEENSCAAEK